MAGARLSPQYFIPPASAKAFIASSCSGVSFSGTATSTCTIRSPLVPSFSIPCQRTRNRFPDAVPAGILIATFVPSSVFTLTREPSVACAMLIGTGAMRSSPSRL